MRVASIAFVLSASCAPALPEALELEEEHGFADDGTTTTYPIVEVGNGWRSTLRILLDVDLGAGTAVWTEAMEVEEDRPADSPEPWTVTEAWTATREGRQVILLPPDPDENGLSCAPALREWDVVLCGEDGTLSKWRERAE